VRRAAAAVLLVLAAVAAAVVAGRGGDGAAAADPGSAIVKVAVDRSPRPAEGAVGFRVAPDVVATVAHTLREGGPVSVVDGRAHPATVAAHDDRTDLALLRVPDLPAGPELALDAGSDPSGRDATVLLPDGERRAAIVRRAVAVRLDGAVRDGLELAARIAPGDSGAPVLVDGRVVGVVFATSREHPGTAWAVAASELAALLDGGA
jgi:S1-C subfamily serine protease